VHAAEITPCLEICPGFFRFLVMITDLRSMCEKAFMVVQPLPNLSRLSRTWLAAKLRNPNDKT
jgi:hypothetical protein